MVEVKKPNIEDLRTAAKYAEMKGISRQFVYRLMKQHDLDFTVIDGITFIVMNQKAKNYKKNR